MRAAASWWVPCAALATALCGAAVQAGAEGRVTGLEHRIDGAQERILVLADGALSPSVNEQAGGIAELVIEDASLDPGAPRQLKVPADGSFLEVTAREERDPPRVFVRVRHAPGMTPRLVQHEGHYALELPRRVAADRRAGIDLAGRDVQLRELVTKIARHTGTPVLYDETLQGVVTIMAAQPFTSQEALLLMDTVLLMKGFAAMPTPGGVRKILRIEGAPWPFVADLAEASGDEAVTTMLRLREISAETVLQALQPLLGNATLAFVHAPNNSLFLAGSAAQIARIVDVIRALDDAGDERIFLRPLRFADVETTAMQLEDAFGDDGLVSVYADTRTNSLSVRARAESVQTVRDFISKLDRAAPARGALHVFRVEHADPEQLAEILRALQSGTTQGAGAAAGFDPVGGAALAGAPFAVVVDPPTHSLVVQADPETASAVRDVVAELDRIPRQVDVEVTVLEIATSQGVDLGFDFFLPLTDPNEPDDLVAFVAGLPTGASALFAGTPVEQTLELGGTVPSLPPVDRALLARFTRRPVIIPVVTPLGVIPVAIPRETAAITAEGVDIYTKVSLRPRITVISGEEHEIFVGENVPILTEQADATTIDSLQTRQNVERQDVGVVLRVKPTLGEAGGIVLELTVEVSVLAPSQAGATANVGPTIRERTLTSKVRLEHDRVAVIGWQAGPASQGVETGIPWLRDIPILGWLFKATSDVTLANNILITVAAWRDDPEVHALAETLRRELGRQRETVP